MCRVWLKVLLPSPVLIGLAHPLATGVEFNRDPVRLASSLSHCHKHVGVDIRPTWKTSLVSPLSSLYDRMSGQVVWENARNVARLTFFVVAFLGNILGLFVIHVLVSLTLRCISRQLFRRVQPMFEETFARLLLSLVQVISGGEVVFCLPREEDDPNVALTRSKFARVFEGGERMTDLSSVLAKVDMGEMDVSANVSPVQRDLLIANHQIYSDWIYLWSLMDRIKRAGEVKIIMKRSLRSVPIFGWSMRLFDFVFLNRKWEQDQVHFTKKLRGFVHSEQPFCLIIFPEGTTLNHKALVKSEGFAHKLGVPPTSRVLLPRVLGMWEAVRALDASLNGVYDITVGYSGLRETDEPEHVYTLGRLFYAGFAPAQIHYHLRYIPIKEIPRDSADAFGEWLRTRYYEKDRLLDEFYRTGQFPHSTTVTKRLCPRYYILVTVVRGIVSVATLFVWFWLIMRYAVPGVASLIQLAVATVFKK